MIRAGLIDEVFDNLQGRIADAVTGVSDWVYVGGWIGLAIAAAVVGGAIMWFVPMQAIRSFVGYAVTMFFAFVFGIVTMFRHERGETKQLRDEIKELKKNQPDDKSGGWHW